MSVLMEQHQANVITKSRLGMPRVASRLSRDYLRSLSPPTAKYAAARPVVIVDDKPLLTLPTKPVGRSDGEQWPAQPRPVFYDEAAPSPSKTWQDILREACIDHEVSMADVLGPRHFKNLVAVRDVVIFRSVVELDMSYAAVGRRMLRDHTTITASLARYARRHPEASAALRAQRERVRRNRQALKEQAVRLYLYGGKTVREIRDTIPLSDETIRAAIRKWSAAH